jgi:hypothetical protein
MSIRRFKEGQLRTYAVSSDDEAALGISNSEVSSAAGGIAVARN